MRSQHAGVAVLTGGKAEAHARSGAWVDRRRFNGRTSAYRPEFAGAAKQLAGFGATDAQLADAFNVSTQTVRNWSLKHHEFGEAIRVGKAEVFDPLVERSLAQRALGYEVDVQELKVVSGKIKKLTIRKYFPPDVTACIFWLKNRRPEKWRDVQAVNHAHEIRSSADILEELKHDILEIGLVPADFFNDDAATSRPMPRVGKTGASTVGRGVGTGQNLNENSSRIE